MSTIAEENISVAERSVWEILNGIPDPEVPAISIVELGVVRGVSLSGNKVVVTMTPTYSGCPALKAMEEQIREELLKAGIQEIEINMIYKPAWTTDWLSNETKQKLKDYGIAPPEKLTSDQLYPTLKEKKPLQCPFCESMDTKLTSQFGSTACKALYFCNHCHQPFEHFKCH